MTTPNPDGRKILLSRVDPEIHDAVGRTARRLGQTASTYIRDALVRAVTADADRVSLANQEHEAEIERLAEQANALVSGATRHDRTRKAS